MGVPNKMKTLISFIVFCTLMFSNLGFAANYYVRFNGGSESNPGTTASPWKYIPGTYGSTHTPSPGDTVYCDRDDTWTLTSNSTAYSTWGPIAGVTYNGSDWEYDGGASGTRARIEYNGGQDNDFQSAITFARDHATYPTVVKGFEVDGNSRAANGILFCGILKDVHIDNGIKRLENCVVHHFHSNIYNYGLRIYPAYNLGIGDANPAKQVRYVEILNNTFYTISRVGIMVYPINANVSAQDITIRGNTVYDIGHQTNYTGCAPSQLLGQNIAIKGNMINVLIENNYVYDSGIAGNAFLVSTGDGYSTVYNNVVIRNNIIDCSRSRGRIGPCFRVSFYSPGVSSMDMNIYDNILYDGGTDVGCGRSGFDFASVVGSSINVGLYNNTLYQAAINIGAGDYTSLGVRNNISYGTGSGIFIGETGSHVTNSNNLTTSPGFKNTSNLPTGFTGTYPNMVPNKDGLSIVAGGAAMDTGTNLGSSYNRGINGVTRSGSLGHRSL